MTPDERRASVFDLADELAAVILVDREEVCLFAHCDGRDDPHGYAIQPRRPWYGASRLPALAYLSHEPGVSDEAYLVALHELGHIAKGRRGTTLDHEAFAWRFAVKVAAFNGLEVSPDIWGRIARDMTSYQSCRRCRPSKDFDRLLREADRRSS